MSHPSPPDPFRPQDTRTFPTYGRGEEPPPDGPASPWVAPGQPQHPDPSPWAPPSTPYGGQPGAPSNGQAGTPYNGQAGAPYSGQAGAQYGGVPGYPSVYGPPPPVYGVPPYGYGYPAVRRTNSLAIAALAVGLSSLLFPLGAPVAVGLGIAALVQVKRRQENGTGLAIVGLVAGSVLSLFWGGILVLALVFGDSGDDDYYGAPEPSATSAPGTSVDDLMVGECFDDAGSEDEVERQVCLAPHDGEVFGVETISNRAWPGDNGMADLAEQICDRIFEPYVGIPAEDSQLEVYYWYPDRSLWSSGDRTVVCAAYGPDGERLTKTVKNSKR